MMEQEIVPFVESEQAKETSDTSLSDSPTSRQPEIRSSWNISDILDSKIFKAVLLFTSILLFIVYFLLERFVTDDETPGILKVGSPCITNNISGTCVLKHKCTVLLYDIYRPDENTEPPEVCSFNGDTPIVCCTSCKYDMTYENISNAVFSKAGFLFWKTGNKLQDMCLEYSKYSSARCRRRGSFIKKWDEELKCHYVEGWEQTAAGGMDAEREHYTHMALLGYGPSVEQAQWLCGGTLISEDFILTAGHCISQQSLGVVSYASLGILKRSDPEPLQQRYRIRRIVPHPEYSPPAKYHDIALLQTHKTVVFNQAVYPACLVLYDDTDSYRVYLYKHVTAIGWGALGPHAHDPMADTLQVIKIQVFSEWRCKSQYPPHRHLKQGYNATTQMCYGDYDNPVDTCQGDSGGPLQVEFGDLCMFFVIGVTSYGRACATAGQAGVYTRVRHYLPWIESVVWSD